MASESKTADSDVRTLLKTLIASKDVMECEIAVLVETVYMGELIDADGFPRADVDIHAVVGQRQRLARLQNDHAALMGSIETALQQLHHQQRTATAAASDATASDGAGSALGAAAAAGSGGDGVDTEHEEHTAVVTAAVEEDPFAIVDEVFPGSPADSAGLREGDQIIRFGTVTRSVCVQSIAPVGRVVREQEGGRVEVVVRRRQAPGSSTTLILSPCQWDGRGLLGCHLERIP